MATGEPFPHLNGSWFHLTDEVPYSLPKESTPKKCQHPYSYSSPDILALGLGLLDLCAQDLLPANLFDSGESVAASTSSDTVELDGEPAPDGRPLRPCFLHPDRIASVYCDGCQESACGECTEGEHRGHACRLLSEVLAGAEDEVRLYLREAGAHATHLRRRINRVHELSAEAEADAARVARNVSLTFTCIRRLLEERERELLRQVNEVRAVRRKEFKDHLSFLTEFAADQEIAEKSIRLGLAEHSDAELLHCLAAATAQQRLLRFLRCVPTGRSNERFGFWSDDEALSDAIAGFGAVLTGGFGPNCVAAGSAMQRALAQRENTFLVQAADHLGRPCAAGGDEVEAALRASDGGLTEARVFDRGDGSYAVTYRPEAAGSYSVVVAVGGALVHGAPFDVEVLGVRDYGAIEGALVTFGQSGSNDGELCRPWGVCCDARGRVIVADRSNDRVQVFDRRGRFLHKFGSTGHEPGQFYRPSGVAADNRPDGGTRIIVVDKDNHRLQVFAIDGRFLFAFGQRGSLPGQFHYPWDAAVQPHSHQICVTDSRNARLQLFAQDGSFLAVFTLNDGPGRALESPRGVAFDRCGNVLVTDFNQHRLLLIDRHFNFVRFLAGKELLNRPQGLDVDQEGNIVVANSKNHDVCVLDSDGVLLATFGTKGHMTGRLQKPTGLAIAPDGLVYVVDFDHTRVQCF